MTLDVEKRTVVKTNKNPRLIIIEPATLTHGSPMTDLNLVGADGPGAITNRLKASRSCSWRSVAPYFIMTSQNSWKSMAPLPGGADKELV